MYKKNDNGILLFISAIFILILLSGCASNTYCENKFGVEKKQCEQRKKRLENDWRYERFNRRLEKGN